jgi:hypothetical protein
MISEIHWTKTGRLYLVFGIRMGFNADLNPAFYLNADPAESQTNVDPCGIEPWSDFWILDLKGWVSVQSCKIFPSSTTLPFPGTITGYIIAVFWICNFCYHTDPDPRVLPALFFSGIQDT